MFLSVSVFMYKCCSVFRSSILPLLLLLLGTFLLPSSACNVRSLLGVEADQAPDQIGSAGGEVTLCSLAHDGGMIRSLSTRLFLPVLHPSF